MPSPQIYLFATRQDLDPGIGSVESERSLKYALCGTFESSATPVWRSLLDLENLGKALKGNHAQCERFIVLPARAELYVETVPQHGGGIRYSVDQLHNPSSIVFQPGGVFGEGYLIGGRIGTASNHPESVGLLGDFTRAVTRGFQKYRFYLVGPEAIRLRQKGVRLITMHVDEAKEDDLNIS